MNIEAFEKLSARQRALISIAVLLDGNQASTYLEYDYQVGQTLKACARELAALAPELRMPLAGTWLRLALQELVRE